jgi:hypothetical protein
MQIARTARRYQAPTAFILIRTVTGNTAVFSLRSSPAVRRSANQFMLRRNHVCGMPNLQEISKIDLAHQFSHLVEIIVKFTLQLTQLFVFMSLSVMFDGNLKTMRVDTLCYLLNIPNVSLFVTGCHKI